jgi:polar amino acid transport system substrate-binding protein
VFSEGCVRDYALAIRSRSGAVTDVLYNASVYHNKAGEVEGVFAAARDVTRSVRAEEALRKLNLELEARVEARTEELRKSEQQVRRKLESILSPEGSLEHLDLKDILDIPAVQSLAEDIYQLTGVPVFLVDRETNPIVGGGWQDICSKFHRVHPQACEACRQSDRELSTGVAPGEFKTYKCKSNLWEIVTPIMLGDTQLGNLFSGQFFFDDDVIDQAVFEQQARRYGFDQSEYLAALKRVPRLTREQVRTGMRVHLRLTNLLIQLGYSGIKLARAFAQADDMNAQLSASFKELEAFAYSVSHDLRAPLRHLDGFLSLLSKRTYSSLDETARHCIDRALEASQRMGRLIDDLLDFSRLGRSDIRLVSVDVSRLVAEVRADLEGATRDRAIVWRVGEMPMVKADQGMLRQVIQNLLTNAIKFTRNCAKAEIEVGSRTLPNGDISIFVRDNGAGFDMQYYDKLFEVFQRLHSEHEFEGTGIGLALVRRIIERHGGRAWAEGAVGQGATFYFSLPSRSNETGDANDRLQSHLVS